MRKSVVFAVFAASMVVMAGLGLKQPELAFGATLDGFAINTQDKAVTVTLYTDQRAQYTTETQGRQFAIILPNTQLSPEQMSNGLPVVIDNQNRFIGRAVPTEDGKVKIILPNLPASEYTVSVQQKRPAQAVATGTVNLAKPHSAVIAKGDIPFEKVAENFPRPASVVRPTIQNADNARNNSRNQQVKTSQYASAPAKSTGTTGGNGTIWNPYVIKASSVPRMADSTYSHYRPVSRLKTRPVAAAMPVAQPIASDVSEEPVNVFSLMDSQRQLNLNPAPPVFAPQSPDSSSVAGIPPKDPLWFLHSLPPAAPSRMPQDELKGLAQEDPFIPTSLLPKTDAKQQNTVADPPTISQGLLSEFKDAMFSLPHWLLGTLALFLGGMGIFTLIGGLVLLRILFSQNKPHAQPTFVLHPGMQFVPIDAVGQPVQTLGGSGKSPYATMPVRPAFKDTASVNAMDYLKDSSNSIGEAVQNTTLLKFPSRSRQRYSPKTSTAGRRTGTGITRGATR